MRQNRDVPHAEQEAIALAEMVASEGDITLVNGQPTVADWAESQPNRAQPFLDESEWGRPSYDVDFAGGDVLGAPWNLAYGSDVVWSVTGWRGVVRRISPDSAGDIIIAVTALVLITPE